MSLLEQWIDQHEARFEGDVGLDYLNELCADVGYDSSGFKYGSPLEQFLSDNPGAQLLLGQFIEDNLSDELADVVGDEEYEEEDESF